MKGLSLDTGKTFFNIYLRCKRKFNVEPLDLTGVAWLSLRNRQDRRLAGIAFVLAGTADQAALFVICLHPGTGRNNEQKNNK